MKKRKNLAIIGATGAVGTEIIKLLEKGAYHLGKIGFFAGPSDRKREQVFKNKKYPIEKITAEIFKNFDIAIFAVDEEVSLKWIPVAQSCGCVCIDNSKAFRHNPEVPLIIPEINSQEIKKHKGVISNPNCTTIISLMALWPLHKVFEIEFVIGSSYQAVSGAGIKGIHELEKQITQSGQMKNISTKVFSEQILCNLIPKIGTLETNDYSEEENKMQNEGRKILDNPNFISSMTCVRVPVLRCHSVSLTAKFKNKIQRNEAIKLLKNSPGLIYEELPSPLKTSNKNEVFVGRVRQDSVFGEYGISLFAVGDQLLKGAALNAVQIMEHLI
jgi:aspartate-semialdehyde dehydrogenase